MTTRRDDLKGAAFARVAKGVKPAFAEDGLPIVEGTDESEDWLIQARKKLAEKKASPA